jgi:hypothetical protein
MVTIMSDIIEITGEDEEYVIGGLDFGRLHDYSALVGLKVQKKIAKMIGLKQWPHVDYSIVLRETSEICREKKVDQLVIDSTDMLVEPIIDLLEASGVSTSGINFGRTIDWTNPWGKNERASIKQAMIEFARACMQEKKVKLPKQGTNKTSDEFLAQLREQQIVGGSNSGHVRYAHPRGRHDDLAWAFLMALFESRTWLSSGRGMYFLRC